MLLGHTYSMALDKFLFVKQDYSKDRTVARNISHILIYLPP